jgi:hypothetical protein
VGALMPEFKKYLPESENAESQTMEQTQNAKKNRIGMGYLLITLTSPKWMIEIGKAKTFMWPTVLYTR